MEYPSGDLEERRFRGDISPCWSFTWKSAKSRRLVKNVIRIARQSRKQCGNAHCFKLNCKTAILTFSKFTYCIWIWFRLLVNHSFVFTPPPLQEATVFLGNKSQHETCSSDQRNHCQQTAKQVCETWGHFMDYARIKRPSGRTENQLIVITRSGCNKFTSQGHQRWFFCIIQNLNNVQWQQWTCIASNNLLSYPH